MYANFFGRLFGLGLHELGARRICWALVIAQSGALPGLAQDQGQAKPAAASASEKPGMSLTLTPEEVAILRQQLEIQQKQIETLQKMTQVLADKLKSVPTTKTPVIEKLEDKTAQLESRSVQAAQRDAEVVQAIDKVNDKLDSLIVNGPTLPPQARQLFLPMQPFETPLSIYGQIFGDYSKPNGKNGMFSSPDFANYFLIQLRQQLLLEASLDYNADGVSSDVISMDYFINKNMTLVAGRFLTPIGWFNERLNHEWINKLPDVPLMFYQVSPLTSTNGLQLRGGAYIGNSPIKFEYMSYLGNGFQLASNPNGLNGIADLGTLTGGSSEVSTRAYGGRLGLWYPEIGLAGGISGYTNGAYAPNSRDGYSLFQIDTNYRKGNIDFRAEYANAYQQAASFIGNNITRQGMYAQLAYRDYNSTNKFFHNLEFVARYGFANFTGINPAGLDLTAYSDLRTVPVNRNQYTLGVNYYFYPSMFIKFAYEINREQKLNFHDDIFMAQAVWAY